MGTILLIRGIFGVYCAVTFYLIAVMVSERVFSNGVPAPLLKRVTLALIWPLAIMSSHGRKALFTSIKKGL